MGDGVVWCGRWLVVVVLVVVLLVVPLKLFGVAGGVVANVASVVAKTNTKGLGLGINAGTLLEKPLEVCPPYRIPVDVVAIS